MCVYVCVYMRVCMHVCMYVCVYMLCVCMCVYMCVCMCVCASLDQQLGAAPLGYRLAQLEVSRRGGVGGGQAPPGRG